MGIFSHNEIYQIFQTVVIYEIFTLFMLYTIKKIITTYLVNNRLENTILSHLPKMIKDILSYLSTIGMKTACIIATFIAILLVSDKILVSGVWFYGK